jgi:predicted Zn-dependent protease
LKANPRAIALWQMKVACYANSGQTDLAIKTLNQLLAISPRNPWALKVRAQLNQAD